MMPERERNEDPCPPPPPPSSAIKITIDIPPEIVELLALSNHFGMEVNEKVALQVVWEKLRHTCRLKLKEN